MVVAAGPPAGVVVVVFELEPPQAARMTLAAVAPMPRPIRPLPNCRRLILPFW